MYAKVKDGQVLEVGEIPGFHVHDDGTSVSGFNFLSPEEWRRCGYLPVEDLSEKPKDPETEELSDQPEYAIIGDKVQMRRRVIKRKKEVAAERRQFRKELDQIHDSLKTLRSELDDIQMIIGNELPLDLTSMDARTLLHAIWAQKAVLLRTIESLSARVEELEKGR